VHAFQRLGIVGGGAWGTALAETLSRAGHDVRLWARNPAVVAEINGQHSNTIYLPGVRLHAQLIATTDLNEVASRDVILLVAPAQQTRTVCAALAGALKPRTPVVICSKGIEQATGRLLSAVVAEALPQSIPAILSGPSFAHDVVRGLPAALTIACADATLGQQLAETIGDRNFRLYWSDDVIGCQLGGAVKNVLAIAAGILDGKRLGASAHAALVTRGFAEMRRFGLALGARPETLQGLSGLGDLLLTCGSAQSRNMSLGRALGEGHALAAILGARQSVSEGVATAEAVADLAVARGLELPIASAVAAIVRGHVSVDQAIEGLLARPFKAED
jgi:glycerol-3-phosphate dehydrogenase (NAD(P)+)